MTERATVDTPTSTFLVIGFIMSTTSSRLAACGFCFYLHSEEESDFREGPGGSDRAGGRDPLRLKQGGTRAPGGLIWRAGVIAAGV